MSDGLEELWLSKMGKSKKHFVFWTGSWVKKGYLMPTDGPDAMKNHIKSGVESIIRWPKRFTMKTCKERLNSPWESIGMIHGLGWLIEVHGKIKRSQSKSKSYLGWIQAKYTWNSLGYLFIQCKH